MTDNLVFSVYPAYKHRRTVLPGYYEVVSINDRRGRDSSFYTEEEKRLLKSYRKNPCRVNFSGVRHKVV